MSKAREALDARDPEYYMTGRRYPIGWKSMTDAQRFDYIAGRIIAEDRHESGVTSHTKLRETGILSESQYRRRQKHEVYDLNVVDTHTGVISEGVYSRTHRKRGGFSKEGHHILQGDVGEHAKLGKRGRVVKP